MIIDIMKHKRKPLFDLGRGPPPALSTTLGTTNNFGVYYSFMSNSDVIINGPVGFDNTDNSLYTIAADGEVLEFDISNCQWNYS